MALTQRFRKWPAEPHRIRDVIAKADKALPAYKASAVQRIDFQPLDSQSDRVIDVFAGIRNGC